mmetsp:Transcript_2773/g.7615  ORF Transcript_2773/g.7615 Transcript_2773/m.7615 type:complete len:431 (-) Transcript_2773:1637-2929(-)
MGGGVAAHVADGDAGVSLKSTESPGSAAAGEKSARPAGKRKGVRPLAGVRADAASIEALDIGRLVQSSAVASPSHVPGASALLVADEADGAELAVANIQNASTSNVGAASSSSARVLSGGTSAAWVGRPRLRSQPLSAQLRSRDRSLSPPSSRLRSRRDSRQESLLSSRVLSKQNSSLARSTTGRSDSDASQPLSARRALIRRADEDAEAALVSFADSSRNGSEHLDPGSSGGKIVKRRSKLKPRGLQMGADSSNEIRHRARSRSRERGRSKSLTRCGDADKRSEPVSGEVRRGRSRNRSISARGSRARSKLRSRSPGLRLSRNISAARAEVNTVAISGSAPTTPRGAASMLSESVMMDELQGKASDDESAGARTLTDTKRAPLPRKHLVVSPKYTRSLYDAHDMRKAVLSPRSYAGLKSTNQQKRNSLV